MGVTGPSCVVRGERRTATKARPLRPRGPGWAAEPSRRAGGVGVSAANRPVSARPWGRREGTQEVVGPKSAEGSRTHPAGAWPRRPGVGLLPPRGAPVWVPGAQQNTTAARPAPGGAAPVRHGINKRTAPHGHVPKASQGQPTTAGSDVERTSRAVGRVLSRAAVAGDAVTVIHLGWPLPTTSCALPAYSGGPPSNARCLGLLRMGFTEPTWSPRSLVVSYTTVSPLLLPLARQGRSVLCGTVPRVAPGGCWPPSCPSEPGPSSAVVAHRRDRPPDSSAASVGGRVTRG